MDVVFITKHLPQPLNAFIISHMATLADNVFSRFDKKFSIENRL